MWRQIQTRCTTVSMINFERETYANPILGLWRTWWLPSYGQRRQLARGLLYSSPVISVTLSEKYECSKWRTEGPYILEARAAAIQQRFHFGMSTASRIS